MILCEEVRKHIILNILYVAPIIVATYLMNF